MPREVLNQCEKVLQSVDCEKVIKLESNHDTQIIVKALEQFKNLEELQLDVQCVYDDETMLSRFVPSICALSKLRNFSWLCVENEGDDDLITISQHTPLMEEFSFYSLSSVLCFPEILTNWKKLKKLKGIMYQVRGEEHYQPEDNQLREFFKAVTSHQCLRELTFDDAFQYYGFGVGEGCPVTSLSFSIFYDTPSELLMNDLSKMKHLKELHLAQLPSNDLFSKIENLKELEVLGVSCCKDEFCETISKLPKLKVLHISFGNITGIGVDWFSKISTLEHIKLLTPPYEIAQLMIEKCPNLKRITIVERGMESRYL